MDRDTAVYRQILYINIGDSNIGAIYINDILKLPYDFEKCILPKHSLQKYTVNHFNIRTMYETLWWI